MARVEIDLPAQFAFRTDIPLLAIHMNVGGHLDNALLLTLVTEARQRCWESMGYNVFDMEGVQLMVADAAVRYLSEALPGEIMTLDMAFTDFHGKGFDIVWRVSDQATSREVARGKTGVLAFDASANKVVLLPEKLQRKLQTMHAQAM
jgi:4-hydroxybenzoyl-CoA thioesterase